MSEAPTQPLKSIDADPSARAAKPSMAARALRLAPIAVIALGAVAAFMAFGDALSFDTLRDNRDALLAWRDANGALAMLIFVAIYTAVVAFSIPGALWMTLAGGFLFGLALGATLIVSAATLGATLIFLAARTSLGEGLKARAGPWLEKLQSGFRENEISFLLILRLVPAVPFFVANLAPAFLGARLSTYVWTTFVGIIPGTIVYTSVGAGLGGVIDAGEEPNIGLLFEPHVIGPLLGLAALAALPAAIKLFRGKRAAASAAATPAE